MFSDVECNLNKGNKILFSRNSLSLQGLTALMASKSHRVLVMWALDCAAVTLQEFELRYPYEPRPRICLKRSEEWARGIIKMPAARRAILDAHAVAKEMGDEQYGALCHAIGHAGATVHAAGHALGLAMYELTAIVIGCGKGNFHQAVREKIDYYCGNLQRWADRTDRLDLDWAKFL